MNGVVWFAVIVGLVAVGVLIEGYERRTEDRRDRAARRAAHIRLMKELENHE